MCRCCNSLSRDTNSFRLGEVRRDDFSPVLYFQSTRLPNDIRRVNPPPPQTPIRIPRHPSNTLTGTCSLPPRKLKQATNARSTVTGHGATSSYQSISHPSPTTTHCLHQHSTPTPSITTTTTTIIISRVCLDCHLTKSPRRAPA